jgi:hypothetical protein
MIFTVFLLGIFYFQGCGGTLNGTIPSSGTLQWTIIAADQLNVLVIFSDWTVSLTLFKKLKFLFPVIMVCRCYGHYSFKSPMNYFSVVLVQLASCKSGLVQMQRVSSWPPIIQAIPRPLIQILSLEVIYL